VRLSFDQLEEIAQGCCDVREEDRGVVFDRMNAPLRELYSATEGWTTCRRSPAGVRLRFRSDTSRVAVSLRYGRSECPSYCVDLFVDDDPVRSAGPEGEAEQWSGEVYAVGTRGERTFDLWMPHVTETWLEWLEVDDDASVTSVAREEVTWLAVGDSITQGMVATSPARSYVAIAARSLGVGVHNVGVGGTKMLPELGRGAGSLHWTFATVAIGVIDWAQSRRIEPFAAHTTEMLGGLMAEREDLPVCLVTPLPVFDRAEENEHGLTVEDYRRALRRASAGFANVTVIEGTSLGMDSRECFVDGVHPNDHGMRVLGSALAQRLSAFSG